MVKPWLLQGSALFCSLFLFMLVGSGSFFSVLLTYLAPFPLFLVGLKKDVSGFGVIGALGAILIFFVSTPLLAIVYLIVVAAPVTFLCENANKQYLDNNNQVIWHPISRLCTWLTIPPATIFIVVFTYFQIYEDSLKTVLAQKADIIVDHYIMILQGQGQSIGGDALSKLTTIKKSFINTAPSILATFWMALIILNGLLAQLLLKHFQQNRRPVFAINEIEVSKFMLFGFLATVLIANITTGPLEYCFTNLATILAFPVLLAGLGVTHTFAKKSRHHRSILLALYLVITFSRWVALIIIFVGVLDYFFKFRTRMGETSTR